MSCCGLSVMRLAVGHEAVQLPHWMQASKASGSGETRPAKEKSRSSSVQYWRVPIAAPDVTPRPAPPRMQSASPPRLKYRPAPFPIQATPRGQARKCGIRQRAAGPRNRRAGVQGSPRVRHAVMESVVERAVFEHVSAGCSHDSQRSEPVPERANPGRAPLHHGACDGRSSASTGPLGVRSLPLLVFLRRRHMAPRPRRNGLAVGLLTPA